MSETMETRMALVEQLVTQLPTQMREGFADLSRQIGRLDARIDGLDSRLSGRLDRLEDRQRSDFHWLLGLILGVYGSGALAFVGVFWLLARMKGWVP